MASIQCKLSLILLCSLYLLASMADATDIRYCTKRLYDVTVSGVEITPFPISRGKETTFSIAASTENPISGGKLVIDVSYFGWKIHSETHDLCNETSCPVSVGDFTIAHSQILPGITPPVKTLQLGTDWEYVSTCSSRCL